MHVIRLISHLSNVLMFMGDNMKKLILMLASVFIVTYVIQTSDNVILQTDHYPVANIDKNIKFDTYKSVNNDYFGYIDFENHVISEPILMGDDNKFYLTHDLYKKDYSSGSVFVDYRYKTKTNNLILYGHYVYRDETLMFSPLHNLLTESYLDYDTFDIHYEHYSDKYQVAYALIFDIENDMDYYYLNNFKDDIDSFNNYNNFYYEKSYIKDRKLNFEDEIIILQTCVKDDPSSRLVVIGKKIN